MTCSEEKARALISVARELTGPRPRRFAVLITPSAQSDEDLEATLRETLPRGRHIVDRLPDNRVDSLIDASRRLGAACLVVPATEALLEGKPLGRLREGVNCPVVMVRGG
ncbi:hypothetical protein [Elongatibacter sediminis]|uniref:Uncharacterized protein n=1 Tax=Elongatibacter sediminis TaxID=3119006 RepID=A0AAW9R4K2_9GAMM